MFNRLLSILKKESKIVEKHRNIPGPISLNIGVRRRTIAHINHQNEFFSKKLNLAAAIVPSTKELTKHNNNYEHYKTNASKRHRDGSPITDPLITLKKNF